MSKRFSESEKQELKKIKIFLCIPATGKTYLASVDKRFVDIDQEEAMYKYNYDLNMAQEEFAAFQGHGEIVRTDSEEYIHKKIYEHLDNGKIILSATHKHILKFLADEHLPYGIIQYSTEHLEYFKERMRKRGNTEDFIEAMLSKRGEAYIRHKNDPNAVAVLDMFKGEFLSDIMWEIFGKPSN